MAPELAIVIPAIGRAPVDETVASIRASVQRADVDAEIAIGWQSHEPPPSLPDDVRVVQLLPAGASYARNRAAETVTAPIVAFVDDDELVDADWAQGLLAAFAADPEVGAVCGAIAPLDDRGLAYCSFSGGEQRRYSGAATLPWTVGGGGNMALRRDVLHELRGFDVTFGAGAAAQSAEDSDLIKRILSAGYDVVWTPDAVVYHPSKTEQERLASRSPYGFGMGKLVRRHRDVRGAAAYAGFGVQSYLTGVVECNARRRREAAATLRAFVDAATRRHPSLAPTRLLERLPDSLRADVDVTRAQPLPTHYRPRPHFVYGIGGERVLHVYAAPTPDLRRAVADREVIRARSEVDGIPRVLAWSEATDSLWLVEERVPDGARRGGPTLRAALEWAAAMARPLGPPLAETRNWDEVRAVSEADAPAHARSAVAAALDRLSGLRSAHSHGDFQPKNVSLVDGRIHVLDWEWARAHDLPGADLLFFAVTAGEPDEVVRALVAGDEPLDVPLRPLLAELEVADEQTLRALLLVLLVRWAGNERRWLAQLGTRSQDARYAELLGRAAPALLEVPAPASVS